MQKTTRERFDTVILEHNAKELAWRQEYHPRLREFGNTSTLQEYLDEYADFAAFGTPATEETIAQAQRLSKPAFPADLLEFYRTLGSFKSSGDALSNLNVLALEQLIEFSLAQDYYGRLPSMGIADTIRHLWVNDRPELEPGGKHALVTAQQFAFLNDTYTCVGYWQRPGDIGESHDLIYFDSAGRFGTLYVHQDYFDILHLLKRSPAAKTLDEVLNESLDRALRQEA